MDSLPRVAPKFVELTLAYPGLGVFKACGVRKVMGMTKGRRVNGVFTTKWLHSTAQGRRYSGTPWVSVSRSTFTPQGLHTAPPKMCVTLAGYGDGYSTQGGANVRRTRFGIPWAGVCNACGVMRVFVIRYPGWRQRHVELTLAYPGLMAVITSCYWNGSNSWLASAPVLLKVGRGRGI